jgi:hypothetical protein
MMSRDDVINVIELMNDSVDRGVGHYEKFKCPITGHEIVVNEKYRKYLSDLGIEAFLRRPGTATDKGKGMVDIYHEYKSMEV